MDDKVYGGEVENKEWIIFLSGDGITCATYNENCTSTVLTQK